MYRNSQPWRRIKADIRGGWKIIGLANEVFGCNGWYSNVTRIETDFLDMDPESRRYSTGVTALVKITLKDGTYHEDIGYGTGDNLRSKGAALDKAKKEAVTDGVKRALQVVKIKPEPDPKFDESDLHHHEKSATTVPSTSTPHDVLSTTFIEPLENTKPISSAPPQMRSTTSNLVNTSFMSSNAERDNNQKPGSLLTRYVDPPEGYCQGIGSMGAPTNMSPNTTLLGPFYSASYPGNYTGGSSLQPYQHGLTYAIPEQRHLFDSYGSLPV